MRGKKIILAASVGGHLTQGLLLLEGIQTDQIVVYTNEKVGMNYTKYYTKGFINGERNVGKQLYVFWKLIIEILKDKPKVVISTGSSIGVFTILLAKFLFRSKTVFVESFSRVTKPTVSGLIAYRIVDRFYYQWKELDKFYPKGICKGTIIKF